MATVSPLGMARAALDEAKARLQTLVAEARPFARPLSDLLDADHRGWMQPLRKVCFRSDTRPFTTIFRDGFLDRETEATFAKTLQHMAGMKPEVRNARIVSLPVTELPSYRNALHYFTTDQPDVKPPLDVDPASAIALTRRLGMAPLFPLYNDDTKTWATETYIYAVWVERAYMTYQRQLADGSKLADAKEVAVRVVPGNHVIAAVRCVRSGMSKPGNTVDYEMKGPIQWNPAHTDGARRLWASRKFEAYLDKPHTIFFWQDTSLLLQAKGVYRSHYKDMIASEDLKLRASVHNTFQSITEALRYDRQPVVDAMQQVQSKEYLYKLHNGEIAENSDTDDD